MTDLGLAAHLAEAQGMHQFPPHPPTAVTSGEPDQGIITDGFREASVAMVFKLLSLTIIFLLSLLGNILVLFVIARHLRLTSFTNAFIASLSTSDLLTTVVSMPLAFGAALTGRRWPFGDTGCILEGFVNLGTAVMSTLMLTAIAVDRYFVLSKQPRAGTSKRNAILTVVLSILWAILVAFPWYALTSNHEPSGRQAYHKPGYHHCMYIFHGKTSNSGNLYSLLVIGLCFLTPLGVMLYCCVRLWMMIRQTDSRIQPASALVSQVCFMGELRTAKTVLVLVVFYIICRMPYICMGLVAVTLTPIDPTQDAIGMWFFWANCAINPIVYAIRNPYFLELLHFGRQAPYRSPSFTNFAPPPPPASRSLPLTFTTASEGGTTQQPSPTFAAAVDIANIARNSMFPFTYPIYEYYTPRKLSVFSTVTASTSTTTL